MSSQVFEWREYETTYILKPEVDDKAAKDFMLKMKDLVEKEKGKNIKVECQGRKKLAWVKDRKYHRGIFVRHWYLGLPQVVSAFERQLNLDDSVLLRQTTLLKRAVDADSAVVQDDFLDVPVVKDRRENYTSFYNRNESDFGDDNSAGEM